MEPGLSLRTQKTLGELLPSIAAQAPPKRLDHSTIFDLSRALNEVIHPELLEFLKSTVEDQVTSEAFALPRASLNGGDPALREALASFFNSHFRPIHAVRSEHIVLTTGATDAIESVIHAVCDDGDAILVPGPHWPNFETILKRKANVQLVVAKPPTYSHWDNYLVPSLQATYDFCDSKDRIKAVLLCNPNNPLSRCYPRKTLIDLLEFCQERGLHLICDEIYGRMELNGADAKAPKFVSALSLTEPLVPEGAIKVDPSRVHVIWSASKLFGMSGFKVGCVVSQQNPQLITALSLLSLHPTTLSTLYLTKLLTWSQLPTLLALNAERLTSSYRILASSLENRNIHVITPTHGVFLCARLAKNAKTAEDEKAFYDQLAVHGVKVAHGRFHQGVDKDFGWARIRFSLPAEEMALAVRRLETFLEKRE